MPILASPGRSLPAPKTPADWQLSLKNAVRSLGELCRLLDLAPADLPGAVDDPSFPLLVPREFVARMERGMPDDPLLRQVLPTAEEQMPVAGYLADPVGDTLVELGPGVLQKYVGRVLTVATGTCAIHCRYCFRRHFPYDDLPDFDARWESLASAIEGDESVQEVILSGGDPLVLSDDRLSRLTRRLDSIPHLRRLRIHTRLPIVIPSRVDERLLAWLQGSRLTPIFVVHANHPAEIDESVARALGRLIDAGIPVLNQAVLLRGVNDRADVLAELSERLINLRVMPYYLHQLDRVAGAAHFEVPIDSGRRFVEELRTRLPGYAVPSYVAEISGQPNKTVL